MRVVLGGLARSPARPGAARASGASGASASGRPSASTRNPWASSSSANADASQAPHTTPPAAPEKPPRCSRSPQDAQAESWGASPAASRSFSRKASWLARVARPASASSRASSWQSRLKTLGVRVAGLEQPRAPRRTRGAAASSAGPSLAQAGEARRRSPRRDRQQVAAALVQHAGRRRKNGSRRPPKRLRVRRTPLAIALDAAAMRGIEVQDAVGLAVADRAQHDRLGLDRAGHAAASTGPSLYLVKQWRTNIIVYTTDPCSFCSRAKGLLQQRGLEYEEINLAKDPDGPRRARRSCTGHDELPAGRHRRRGRRRLHGARPGRPLRAPARAGRARRRGRRAPRGAPRGTAPPSARDVGTAGSARTRRSPAPPPRTSRSRAPQAGHGSPRRRWTRNSSWKDPRTPSAWRKSSIVAPPASIPASSAARTAPASSSHCARVSDPAGRSGWIRARNSASSA